MMKWWGRRSTSWPREGARRVIEAALQVEVEEYVTRYRESVTRSAARQR